MRRGRTACATFYRSGPVRTIEEVREEFRRRTGITLTPQRVWQLTRSAERKIAKALAGESAA